MSFSNILAASNRICNIDEVWNATEAAEEFGPLPPGEYVAHVVSGQRINSKTKNTPGYEIVFQVIDGEVKGRKIWHQCWLTALAMPATKRDLAKIGISEPSQMDRPLKRGMRCKCHVTLRQDDQGRECNRVRSFEFVGIDEPVVDPFAPAPTASSEESRGA